MVEISLCKKDEIWIIVWKKLSEELMELVENYEGVGSGWVFDHFQRIDFNLTSFFDTCK